ncbi:MAG: ABC transporter ATP-binding protein [Nanoarchaeota archaeon]|nr:ABC transporter ATP-binding protein [Nanoarchaeota archaeon]
MIDLKDVWRIYDMGEVKVPALQGIDFTVKKGEFVSVMGRSGSGKSTLLHIAGVLDRQTKGSVRIEGTNVLTLTERQRTLFRLDKIGFVFQFYSLLPELTAVENVMLPQLIIGETREHAHKQAKKVMDLLEIGKRLNNYPHQLSGGEQQRVGIARALVNDPLILFADEPTASLDTTSAKIVIEAFRKLHEERGQTTIMITHEEALGREAERGVWLKDGKIEKEKRF